MQRPLVLFCLSLMCGILAAKLSNSYIFALISSMVLGIIILVLLSTDRKYFFSIGIIPFYLLGSFYYLYSFNGNIQKFYDYQEQQVIIKGYIDSTPNIKQSKISYTLRTESIGISGEYKSLKKIKGKVLFSMLKSDKIGLLEYGKEITVSGKLNLPKGMTNPGGFDLRSFLSQSDVSATVFAVERNIKPGEGNSGNFLVKLGLFLRNRIVYVINQSLPPQQAGLLNGMLIGYREGLTKDVQQVFSDSGLSHIMAVSGANVAFMVFPLIFVFKKLRLRQTVSNITIINILVIFTFITGFEPSVLRAVIMAIVILIGQIMKRETEVFTSLAFAAIVLLLYNPGSLFNIGFQLSFAATISLVLFYNNIKEKINSKCVPEGIIDVLSGTLAAQLGVLPVTVFYFNKISIISILSNLIVVPVVEFITILGSLMAVLGQVHIFFSQLIGFLNNTLLSFVLFASKITADFPFAVVQVTTPTILVILAYYFLLVFFLWYKPKYKVILNLKHYAGAAGLVFIIILVNLLIPKPIEIIFVDIGQGDCTFIRTPSGKTVLIDGGGSSAEQEFNVGESVLVPFLLDYGINRLDLVIGTHGHDDHIKGLIPVLNNIEVVNFLMPDTHMKEEFQDILEIADSKKTKVNLSENGDVVRLDKDTYFKVLHPDRNNYIEKSALNNNSLVLKLHYRDISVLFTADLEAEGEQLLLDSGIDIAADVIKIGHHGSQYSSVPEFIERVNPAAAVISVGKNNFGHPSKTVLNLLENKAIKIFRTDLDGAVMLRSFGRDIKIETMIK